MDDEAESLDGGESLLDESLPDAQDAPEAPMESLDAPEADLEVESLLDVGVDDGASLDGGTADHGSDDGPDHRDGDATLDYCGPYAGSGLAPTTGSCIATYRVGVYAGEEYLISGCGTSAGDPVLLTPEGSACVCASTSFCGGMPGGGDECRCTAIYDADLTICASGIGGEWTSWSYEVFGPCYLITMP